MPSIVNQLVAVLAGFVHPRKLGRDDKSGLAYPALGLAPINAVIVLQSNADELKKRATLLGNATLTAAAGYYAALAPYATCQRLCASRVQRADSVNKSAG
jgi:hypothetical protein